MALYRDVAALGISFPAAIDEKKKLTAKAGAIVPAINALPESPAKTALALAAIDWINQLDALTTQTNALSAEIPVLVTEAASVQPLSDADLNAIQSNPIGFWVTVLAIASAQAVLFAPDRAGALALASAGANDVAAFINRAWDSFDSGGAKQLPMPDDVLALQPVSLQLLQVALATLVAAPPP